MSIKAQTRRVCYNQLEYLYHFLRENIEIGTGFNKTTEAREMARRAWKKAAIDLNAMQDGAVKDWKGWSKYWNDYKSKLWKINLNLQDPACSLEGKELRDIEKKFLQLLEGRRKAKPRARESNRDDPAESRRQAVGNSGQSAGKKRPETPINTEDVSDNDPSGEQLDELALQVTLARIKSNPLLYIGIPKNCYHLVDILHQQSHVQVPDILLCLKKIKLDTHFDELADQFGITAIEARTIFVSHVPTLAKALHSFIVTRKDPKTDTELVSQNSNNNASLDSLQIKIQPTNLTVKYLIGSSSDGFINYVSPGYRNNSDTRIIEETKYLDTFKPGDRIVTRIGNLETLATPRQLTIIRPYSDQSKEKSKECRNPVEVVRKSFAMVNGSVANGRLLKVMDEVVVVACALMNLQSCIYFVN